jgi:adenosylmethionine-8-amino-7-oxononanoate aminotransferase
MAISAADSPSVLIQQDREHLVHPLHHPDEHEDATIFVKGNGALVSDIYGNEYVDGLSALWNVNIGHGRKELAEAGFNQLQELAYASNYVGSANVNAIKLAALLAEISYPSLNATYFTSGGAESNDSAIKTARFFWISQGKKDKIKIISRNHAYHGVTIGAMSATGMSPYHKMFGPLAPGFVHIEPPYTYRRDGDPNDPDLGKKYAKDLEDAIIREGADTVAAFIAEPVQGAGGVIPPPNGYFQEVRRICDKYDVLYIADEVITGFGRTGHMFALTHWGIEPDIMSFAKGVTSGYLPLGGIMLSDRVHRAILDAPLADKWMHAYTYSGHPTCCAVGLANVNIMIKERLPERAMAMGNKLLEGLQELQDHPNVGEVRGLGMMAAVELVSDKTTKAPFDAKHKVADRCMRAFRKRGMMTRCRGDVMMFAPPLVITDAQMDTLLNAATEGIKEVMAEIA